MPKLTPVQEEIRARILKAAWKGTKWIDGDESPNPADLGDLHDFLKGTTGTPKDAAVACMDIAAELVQMKREGPSDEHPPDRSHEGDEPLPHFIWVADHGPE